VTELSLDTWLNDLPLLDFYREISPPRRYDTDEGAYDAQYGIDETMVREGLGAVNLLRHHGYDFRGTALEIGCGTGRLSLGLARSSAFEHLLLTDCSPSFLKITARKIGRVDAGRVDYATLMGEDLGRFPPGSLSAVLLNAALHHVVDVDKFLADISRALAPGGFIVFLEPCTGMLTMGMLAHVAVQTHNGAMSPEQCARFQAMADCMTFYHRRDIDKANSEDKHLFNPHEMIVWSRRHDIEMDFYPNAHFAAFHNGMIPKDRVFNFTLYFRNHLKYCMNFDDELLALYDTHVAPFAAYMDVAAQGGGGPFMEGVFIGRKAGSPA